MFLTKLQHLLKYNFVLLWRKLDKKNLNKSSNIYLFYQNFRRSSFIVRIMRDFLYKNSDYGIVLVYISFIDIKAWQPFKIKRIAGCTPLCRYIFTTINATAKTCVFFFSEAFLWLESLSPSIIVTKKSVRPFKTCWFLTPLHKFYM